MPEAEKKWSGESENGEGSRAPDVSPAPARRPTQGREGNRIGRERDAEGEPGRAASSTQFYRKLTLDRWHSAALPSLLWQMLRNDLSKGLDPSSTL